MVAFIWALLDFLDVRMSKDELIGRAVGDTEMLTWLMGDYSFDK
jgi:hypothetical protein